MENFIQDLKKQLAFPLPGKKAQYKMAHVVRKRGEEKAIPSDARKAGVMILFYKKNGEAYFVLTKRVSTHKADKHSGQMSFPGGQYEAVDEENLAKTALRETEEEIGVPAHKIDLLGALTPLYIPVSNFQVFPFVGYLDEKPQFKAQASEVQTIVETSFSLLQNPATRQEIDLNLTPQIILKRVPYFNVLENVVWGATAMILSELLEVVK